MSCCDKILRGAASLARAAIGLDRASAELQLARAAACESCEHLRGAWPLAQCRLCGCLVAVKRRLAGETCPAGRWPSPPAAVDEGQDPPGGQ